MITWPEFQIPSINLWNVWYLQAKQEERDKRDKNTPQRDNKAFCEGRARMFTTLYNKRNSNAT